MKNLAKYKRKENPKYYGSCLKLKDSSKDFNVPHESKVLSAHQSLAAGKKYEVLHAKCCLSPV